MMKKLGMAAAGGLALVAILGGCGSAGSSAKTASPSVRQPSSPPASASASSSGAPAAAAAPNPQYCAALAAAISQTAQGAAPGDATAAKKWVDEFQAAANLAPAELKADWNTVVATLQQIFNAAKAGNSHPENTVNMTAFNNAFNDIGSRSHCS